MSELYDDSNGRRPHRAVWPDRGAEGATAIDWSTVTGGGWDDYILARARAFARLRSQSAAYAHEAEDR
jgi:hypothetical protein